MHQHLPLLLLGATMFFVCACGEDIESQVKAVETVVAKAEENPSDCRAYEAKMNKQANEAGGSLVKFQKYGRLKERKKKFEPFVSRLAPGCTKFAAGKKKCSFTGTGHYQTVHAVCYLIAQFGKN